MLFQPRCLKSSSSIVNCRCQFLLRRLYSKANHGKVEQAGNHFRNREINGEERFHLYKGWGQHLLTNTRILDAIVRRSNIRSTDTVLEIGPGTGNLTLKLLEAANKVVAVEIDERMADALHKRVAANGLQDRITVICQDALKAEFPHFDLVVANIPYGISSPLIAKLVFGERQFRSATLLLQKEFARRLLAKPGDSEFNRLAVNVKLVADVEFIMDVSKREFVPIPKVDSSVIKIHPKAAVPDVDLNEWWSFTRICFSKKNKTLGATFKQKKKLIELMRLSNYTSLDKVTIANDEEETMNSDLSSFKEKLIKILESNGFADKRPLKIPIDELLRLLSLFNQQQIHFHCKAGDKQTVDHYSSDE